MSGSCGSCRSGRPNALAVYLLLSGKRRRALLCRALRISPAFGLDELKFTIPALQLVTALASEQPTNLDAWQATTKRPCMPMAEGESEARAGFTIIWPRVSSTTARERIRAWQLAVVEPVAPAFPYEHTAADPCRR